MQHIQQAQIVYNQPQVWALKKGHKKKKEIWMDVYNQNCKASDTFSIIPIGMTPQAVCIVVSKITQHQHIMFSDCGLQGEGEKQQNAAQLSLL